MLDIVEHITNIRTQAPLLLISLSRPELLDRRPNWGAGRQNFTSLALQPLTAKQTQDLVQKLTSELSERVRQQIAERSGGNPFFALELIRSLMGRSLHDDEAVLDILPDTIHAAVLARLDLLLPIERQVLQVAAVASRTIRMSMLQTILSDHGPQEIECALNGLQIHDILVPGGSNTFTFRHILFRDVAYGTLSRAERIRLHGKIATWLETAAAEHLDEYTEVIAYHHREAVVLAHQSTIPQAVPLESERALHFLRRAGEIASRAGAYAEAQNYLRSAITIAPESELLSLYEQFGDSDSWTQVAVDSYWKALNRWRTAEGAPPIIGARLLRKILIAYTRGFLTMPFDRSRFLELWQEAQHLAKAAEDEGEQWRIRIVDFFWHNDSVPLVISPEEAEERKEIALAATMFFEQRADWIAFSEILDAYASLLLTLGAYHDALIVLKRRLSAPGLPAIERGDAYQMIARTYADFGDYQNCIATIEDALSHTRPGQPLIHLSMGVSRAIAAAFVIGRWSAIETLTKALEEIRDQTRLNRDPSYAITLGYYTILQVALAREDSASANAAASILMRIFPDATSNEHILLTTILKDDVQKTDFEHLYAAPPAKLGLAPFLLVFCSERGTSVPFKLIEYVRTAYCRNKEDLLYCDIAQALAQDDNVQLVNAIDAAEAFSLFVHTARMRIVLAQRTGNRIQLERARAVLAPLQDRQFLRRLEEVEMMLYMEQPLLKAE